MKKGTAWKRLTRDDLTTFDQTATDAVLTAMAHGGLGRVSARGHVQIRTSDGRTMAVGRDTSAPHCAQNVRASLRRLFPEVRAEIKQKKVSMQQELSRDIKLPRPIFTDVQLPAATNGGSAVAVAPAEEPMLKCPARQCEAEFETEAARQKHIDEEHATCKWPGCDRGLDGGPYVAYDNRGMAGHVGTNHKENKPWDASKKAAEAKKAAKQSVGKVAVQFENGGVLEIARDEHRGLSKGPVKHKPSTDAAKIAAIREALGPDPKIAVLEAEIADLHAQLDLIREAAGLHPGRK